MFVFLELFFAESALMGLDGVAAGHCLGLCGGCLLVSLQRSGGIGGHEHDVRPLGK